VLGNRVLKGILTQKRDEITGSWRKSHNEELHSLHPSPNIIKMIIKSRMRWAGHVTQTGENRNAYKVLVAKPEGQRPLGVGGRIILKWM
jgi:hypothetical protein